MKCELPDICGHIKDIPAYLPVLPAGTLARQLDMPEDKKAQISRLLVVKPLPFVKTVIFFSTPHRGSFQSKAWTRNLLRWLISLPANIVKTTMDNFDYMTDDVRRIMGGRKTIFTSADGMSPDNPMLKVLAETPLAPWIKGHSIIAVQGDGDPKLGDDGVVKYSSAHLDGMASEFIVKSGHSSQLNPLAIDEMRRILLEKLENVSKDHPTDPNLLQPEHSDRLSGG